VKDIPVRLGIQQRVLPDYRVPFFEMLASTCNQGFTLFAGLPRQDEAITTRNSLQNGQYVSAKNWHLLKGSAYFCYQSGFIHWLNNWQPDVLIVEANPRYLSTPSAIRWMHQRGRPVIGWGLGSPPTHSSIGKLYNQYRRHFFRQFDALIAYSQQGALEYQQTSGLSNQFIWVAINAAVARPTHPIPQRPLLQPGQRPIIISVGRLQARKRIDMLLSACASLAPENRPDLWIVGDGPQRANLEDLSHQIYPQAKFYGAKHGADLNTLLTQADCFVLPGTGGLAVQQAMSFGLPVIVAEADGTQTNLVSPDNGWVLPAGDLSALQQTLRQALSDIPRLRQMGAVSYDKVSREANLENMVKVFGKAVTGVLENTNEDHADR
jgi:glycosyltransferase involved in cell wall biosynthesis